MALPRKIVNAANKVFAPVKSLKDKYNQAQSTWKASPRYKKAQQQIRNRGGLSY